jgi:hypothetical protein
MGATKKALLCNCVIFRTTVELAIQDSCHALLHQLCPLSWLGYSCAPGAVFASQAPVSPPSQ